MCDAKKMVEERRKKDAELTAKFLEKNGAGVGALAQVFSREMRKKPQMYENFYLKGSNAIALLEGQDCKSDYDFEFVPTKEVYGNWKNEYGQVDAYIRSGLRAAAEKIVFLDEGAQPADNGKIGLEDNIFLRDYPEKKYVSGEYRIGAGYMGSSFREIIGSRDYDKATGRLLLKKQDIVKAEGKKFADGVYLYVNYTIPGFLLYRLVFAAKISLMGQDVIVKSEMLDVSVPRLGSAECFMAQEGVITHFREAGDFRIPGWGYHFYENINLCQEIELGCSGSPHKKTKREERLKKSIQNLLPRNPVLWGKTLYEEEGEALKGYQEAFCYPVETYEIEASGYQEMIQALKERLGAEAESHLKTVAGGISVRESGTPLREKLERAEKNQRQAVGDAYAKALAKLFVFFRTGKNYDHGAPTVGAVKKGVQGVMQNGATYITPLPKSDDEGYRLGFLILKGEWGQEADVVEITDDENAALLRLHIEGGVVYAVALKKANPAGGNILTDLLGRTILFSQRRLLQEMYEKLKN